MVKAKTKKESLNDCGTKKTSLCYYIIKNIDENSMIVSENAQAIVGGIIMVIKSKSL